MKMKLIALVTALSLPLHVAAADLTRLYKNVNQSIPSSSAAPIQWNVEQEDDLGFFNPAQNTKIVVPAGVSKIRIHCGVVFQPNVNGMRQIYLQKNGNSYPVGYISVAVNGGYSNGSSVSFTAVSGILDVVAGDYFELMAYQTSGAALNVSGVNSTWINVEVIE